jgi:RNA polymerase sigma factor (sigma-70 family)
VIGVRRCSRPRTSSSGPAYRSLMAFRDSDLGDAELIAASWDHPEIFATLFDRYFQSLFAFAFKRVGGSRAEDIAGETFRRAFEHRRSYDVAQQSARGWLMRIALNIIRDEARLATRQEVAYGRLAYSSYGQTADFGDSVVAAADATKEIEAVASLLAECSPEEVNTLLLYAWDELSYSEIAVALEIPIGTVRSRINRARRQLRRAAIVDDSHYHDGNDRRLCKEISK